MIDVLIAGAGPAGSLAALLLARAQARVIIVDRAAFPRDKLCGDTLNPGALRLLASLGLTGGPLDRAVRLGGMRVSGPHASVSARYGDGIAGAALPRRDFDQWLLEEALRAGARFEGGLTVRRPLVEPVDEAPVVRGLVLARAGTPRVEHRLPAALTIAADGRRSVVAAHLGLSRPVRSPRRWAFGVYATGVEGMTDLGEMHIRPGWYAGLAPLPGPLVNICVVTGPRPAGRTPDEIVRRVLARDPELAARTAGATFAGPVRVLGPLAAQVTRPGTFGLLLAGDAAGFVDPMTGDGLHLAMQSAVLAAEEALATLERGHLRGSVERLTRARQRAFGRKLRFNRLVRRLVDSPSAVGLAAYGARLAPALIRQAIRYAGDAA